MTKKRGYGNFRSRTEIKGKVNSEKFLLVAKLCKSEQNSSGYRCLKRLLQNYNGASVANSPKCLFLFIAYVAVSQQLT
jgi:hypothetical protein